MKQLNDSRSKKTFTAVDPKSVHDHGPDEPCGESCSKDHKPEDHPLNIMVGMHGQCYHPCTTYGMCKVVIDAEG